MQIRTKSLIEGLSYALDIAEGSYLSHSKHVAYTSVLIAEELKLSKDIKKRLYYSALLHDIGAGNKYGIVDHSLEGARLVKKLPIDERISDIVLYHHESYDGRGAFNKKGDDIPIESQIIFISSLFDNRYSKQSTFKESFLKEVLIWLDKVSGIVSEEVYIAFKKLLNKEFFILDYFNDEFSKILKSKSSDIDDELIDSDDVIKFAKVFSLIIDNRNSFTHNHSVGIGSIVHFIVRELGYEEDVVNEIYIAALLHDIGKLAVDNNIINKNGKLTSEERYEVNKHTYFTKWILEQIDGFEEISKWASNHHEKLDGSGYPRHLKADQLDTEDRVIAIADIYQALTEERPYRKRLKNEKVWEILFDMANKNELDIILVKKIKIILDDMKEGE